MAVWTTGQVNVSDGINYVVGIMNINCICDILLTQALGPWWLLLENFVNTIFRDTMAAHLQ